MLPFFSLSSLTYSEGYIFSRESMMSKYGITRKQFFSPPPSFLSLFPFNFSAVARNQNNTCLYVGKTEKLIRHKGLMADACSKVVSTRWRIFYFIFHRATEGQVVPSWETRRSYVENKRLHNALPSLTPHGERNSLRLVNYYNKPINTSILK